MEQVDVLVVGGGPAGLSAAETVFRGAKTLLVHKDKEIGLPVRTSGGSWKAHIDALGIPSSLYTPIHNLVFHGPTKSLDVKFKQDCPVVLDVTGTYQFLARQARSATARVECSSQFKRVLDVSKDRIACEIEMQGVKSEVAARFIIDASGHQRAVLANLGLEGRPQRVGVGVEYEFENAGTDPHQVGLFVGTDFTPSGYGWIFPTNKNTIRVGIGVIRPDTARSPKDMLHAFLKSGQAKIFGLKLGPQVEAHFGVIPSDGPSGKFINGRVVAVGDSANQALSLIGEGIRYSIEAGRRAGAAVSGALAAGEHFDKALAEYENWWNRKYRRRFTFAQKANIRMSGFSDHDWDTAIRFMGDLSGDEMAKLLRMEVSKKGFMWIAIKSGAQTLPFILRQMLLKYFPGQNPSKTKPSLQMPA